MNKIVLLMSLIFFANLTFAGQADLANVSGVSFFDKIHTLYKNGKLLDLNTIASRIASGRCFLVSQPNVPVATYLTATKTTTDVGPIEPPIENFAAALQFDAGVAPSYFDADSIQITDERIAKWRLPVIMHDDRTYVLNYPTKEAAFIRQSGSYIIALLNDPNGNLRLACSYFKIH